MLFDVCVIGAGINGSSAAYTLAKQQKKVLLLEQFPLPHTRGSSHGQSRVTRALYRQYHYSKMSSDSFPLWRQLEKEVGETLFIQNGMLEVFDPHHNKAFNESCDTLRRGGVSFDVYEHGSDINRAFPLFDFPGNICGIHEKDGGMLLASKCLRAFQKLFKDYGGILNDREKVLNICPGEIIEITSQSSKYFAKSIIIAAGPYTSELTIKLGIKLPLEVVRTHACYWRVSKPDKATPECGFPSFFCYMKKCFSVYGLPIYEYPGLMKICVHNGKNVEIDNPDCQPDLEKQKVFIRNYAGCIDDAPAIVENCFYTNTPDRDFIIDKHPSYNNIVIAAGFSGTGFKMAPVTGRILADLSLNKVPQYDISMFSMKRFNSVSVCKSNL